MKKKEIITLDEQLGSIKKWMKLLNEENRIGVGHFPDEEQTPQYRESWGEGKETPRTGTDLGSLDQMDGYMDNHGMAEEEEVSDDVYEFKIPEWAVSALINGDTSGLEEEDIKKIESFVNNTSARYGNANFSLPSDDQLELGFCRTNDIDNLGSNCYKLLLRVDDEIPEKTGDDQHAVKNYDDFESGAIYEDDEMGDVKLSMAIMSHLSDLQERYNNSEFRAEINFIKSMIMKVIKEGDKYVSNQELDVLRNGFSMRK